MPAQIKRGSEPLYSGKVIPLPDNISDLRFSGLSFSRPVQRRDSPAFLMLSAKIINAIRLTTTRPHRALNQNKLPHYPLSQRRINSSS